MAGTQSDNLYPPPAVEATGQGGNPDRLASLTMTLGNPVHATDNPDLQGNPLPLDNPGLSARVDNPCSTGASNREASGEESPCHGIGGDNRALLTREGDSRVRGGRIYRWGGSCVREEGGMNDSRTSKWNEIGNR